MDGVECTAIMYHYVRNMHETEFPAIKGLLLEKFRGQLGYVERHFKVISLAEYGDCLRGNSKAPEKSCLLTFDDGVKDHYLNVFPELEKRGFAAGFFPMTQPLEEGIVPVVQKTHFLLAKLGAKDFAEEFNRSLKERFPDLVEEFFVDDGEKRQAKHRWDDALTSNLKYNIATMPLGPKVELLNAIFPRHFGNEKEFCGQLYMNWEEMREMEEAGMEFGGHTHSHPTLASLDKEGQEKEIIESTGILRKGLRGKIRCFSYPYGSFNQDTIEILQGDGYEMALTTDVGVNKGIAIDPFKIKRFDTNDIPCSGNAQVAERGADGK